MAARNGYLEVLQWARAHGCPWNDHRVLGMCEGAAYGGHLKVLKWARAKGCDWDNDKMCMIAAGGGQLEILK